MKISKFHKVVRFQVCDPYFRSSFSLHLCAYKCNLPSQSRRKVRKYGGFFLEGRGGTVCSNGFYADIWSQRQVQQYESCLILWKIGLEPMPLFILEDL